MKIAYVGAYDSEYPRNRIIVDGLRRSGAEVVEFNIELKGTKSTSFQSHRFLNVISLLFRQVRHQVLLAWTLVKARKVDAIVVGFPGYQDIPLAYVATRARRIPLIFDPLVSVYETLVEDRQLYKESSFFARAVRRIEKVLFRLPDLVIADTDVHAEYFSSNLGARRVSTSYVGATDRFFVIEKSGSGNGAGGSEFKVLFYGSYIPLHGIEHIVEAAKILRDEPISFEIIGTGQLFEGIEKRVNDLGLEKFNLRGWADQEQIVSSIRSADLCLGIFGATAKAGRVVPNKVFECLAAGKPVLTMDSAASREVLQDGTNVFLCEPGDGAAIAKSIRSIKDSVELRATVGGAAAQLSKDRFTSQAIGESVLEAVENLKAA